MAVLSDVDLLKYIREGKLKVVPLSEDTVRENGLDLRLGNQIARLRRTAKVFEPGCDLSEFYEVEEADSFIIGPHEHVLLHTLEYVKLPNDLMGFVNLRSTFARLGLFIPPCLHPETPLLLGDGSVKEAYEVSSLLLSFSLNDYVLKPAKARKVNAWSDFLVEIETERFACKVTPRHKFLTYRGGELVELMASELKPNDLLAVPLLLNFPRGDNVIKRKLAMLLGYLSGKGEVEGGNVLLKGDLHPYVNLAEELGGYVKRGYGEAVIRGKLARLILSSYTECLKDGEGRRVPRALDPEYSHYYLAGLFDAVSYERGGNIILKLPSGALTNEVQLLLLKEGVYAFKEANCLVIKGVINISNFKERVGKYCHRGFSYETSPCNDDYVYLTEDVAREAERVLEVRADECGWLLNRSDLEELNRSLRDGSLLSKLSKLSKLRWDRVLRVKFKEYGGVVVDFEEPLNRHYLAGPFITHNTVIDAGFEGQLTIELVGGEFPVRLTTGTRFLHVIFSKLSSPASRPYKGKYQGQRGVKLPKF